MNTWAQAERRAEDDLPLQTAKEAHTKLELYSKQKILSKLSETRLM